MADAVPSQRERESVATPMPQACPGRFLAVLGMEQPAWLPCAGVAGHECAHWYKAEWTGDGDAR